MTLTLLIDRQNSLKIQLKQVFIIPIMVNARVCHQKHPSEAPKRSRLRFTVPNQPNITSKRFESL
uniref:Uncharacterized protein n=1 Tax=Enterovibrio norvegicus TaxID=188144 RepID=A0A0H3ZPX0_9GAMM|nr:hypothetical protein [Enterovibrio norvegicus]